MKTTMRNLAVAASLLMGTALAASAAVTADSQGNTAPTASSSHGYTTGAQYGSNTAVTTSTPPSDTTSGVPATAMPKVNGGDAQSAASGGGGGGAGGSGH